jgi:hypothetical protein
MKRVPKKLWDDRLSRALSSVARCGCIVCAAIILLCSVVNNNNNNNTRNSRVSELWLLLSWRSLLSCTTQSRAFGSVDWYVNINSFKKLWGNETITIELHPSPINRRRKLYTFIPEPSTGGGSCINSFNKLWDEQLHPRHINRRKVYTFIPGTSTGGRCTPSSTGGRCTTSSDPSTGGRCTTSSSG